MSELLTGMSVVPPTPAPPVPAYADGQIAIYLGDARELLQGPVAAPTAVVLTDPPYAAWRYLQEMQESKKMNALADVAWQASIFEWVTDWYWPMTHQLGEVSCSWVFCNLHYLGFYLRWARLGGWTQTRIFQLAGEEYLIYAGHEALTLAAQARVGQALADRNRYGHGKDVDMLRQILRESPSGHVLDPFAGQGTTLEAARREGRTATGIEIVPESVASVVARLGANGAAH